jgi:hypothetical protein
MLTSFYVPDHPDVIGQLVFLLFYKIDQGNLVHMGQSDDYTTSSFDADTWVELISFMDYFYEPGDSAIAFYGTYGSDYPIPYAEASANSSYVSMDDVGGITVIENGPVFMLNLKPLSSYDCTWCDLSLTENSKPNLEVFPNPAITQIQITGLTQPLQHIRILSMDGREMLSEENPVTETISISFLDAGTYLIFAQTINGEILTEKFVKL